VGDGGVGLPDERVDGGEGRGVPGRRAARVDAWSAGREMNTTS